MDGSSIHKSLAKLISWKIKNTCSNANIDTIPKIIAVINMYLADDESNFNSTAINLLYFIAIPHIIVVSISVSEIVLNTYKPLIRVLTSRI